MRLQDAMKISEERPEFRICREPNYGCHYRPIFFTSNKGVLMVHDIGIGGGVHQASFQKSDHNDWMLYNGNITIMNAENTMNQDDLFSKAISLVDSEFDVMESFSPKDMWDYLASVIPDITQETSNKVYSYFFGDSNDGQ